VWGPRAVSIWREESGSDWILSRAIQFVAGPFTGRNEETEGKKYKKELKRKRRKNGRVKERGLERIGKKGLKKK
jgi:hypothetical protein